MRTFWKRTLSTALALLLTVGAMIPTASAATLPMGYDETYYATLDYYGGVTDASVVKSYRLNGGKAVTDYGTYDEVVNLTDDRPARIDGGKVVFDLGEETPEKFYFEGKTRKPYEELPWNISVSYKHNGAPALAEDLGGKSGLFEIDLDLIPDATASEYSRNNLVLTAAAAFNDDDITSLEAPGAEVQLIGNLRVVLFAALPGEEQHFAIRVGSDDFTFTGLFLLAVPATLQQLDQVNDLREAKEKAEDSYHAIDDSLDVILNSLEGMSGSLNAAAGGLDQLNAARKNVSDNKGPVYDQADLALGDLDALADALGKLDPYTDTLSQAVTDLTGSLTGLTDSVTALRPELGEVKDRVEDLQKDTANLRKLMGTVEDFNDEEFRTLVRQLGKDAKSLNADVDDLTDAMDALRVSLDGISGLNTVSSSEITGGMTVDVGGQKMTVAEIQEAVRTAERLKKGYEDYAAALVAAGQPQPTMQDFLQYYVATQAGLSGWDQVAGLPAEQQQALGAKVQEAADLLTTMSDPAIQAKLTEMEQTMGTLSSALTVLNNRIGQANAIIRDITQPTADLLQELQFVCNSFTDKGLTDDLGKLTDELAGLLEDLDERKGDVSAFLKDTDKAGDLLSSVSEKGEAVLDRLEELDGVVNSYEPQTQAAIADLRTLSGSLQSTLHDTKSALSSAEELLRSTGPELDQGTRNTLNGVSASLRKATVGLDQTDTIRNAKATLTDLIEDEWDSHTGEDNNLLLMDASAAPESMTDPRNPTPGNIQYVMRTQEIKVPEEPSGEEAAKAETEHRSVWQKIVDMFRDIWNKIVSIFR